MAYFASSADPLERYFTRFTIQNTQTALLPTTNPCNTFTQAIVFCQGHLSPQAADYVNKNLVTYLNEETQQNPELNLGQVLTSVLNRVQTEMLGHWRNDCVKSGNGHNWLGGTSVTVALVTKDNKVVTAHIGGSALYLTSYKAKTTAETNEEDTQENSTTVTKLTKEHTLKNADEFQKIAGKSCNAINYLIPKPETDNLAETGEMCVALQNTSQRVYQSSRKEYRDTSIVPMLSLSRTLGDFWNLSKHTGERILRHDPDINEINLDREASNHLVFLSQNLAKVINQEHIQDIMNHAHVQDNMKNIAQIFFETAVIVIRREKTVEFQNLAVLVVTLDRTEKYLRSQKISKMEIATNSIYYTTEYISPGEETAVVPIESTNFPPKEISIKLGFNSLYETLSLEVNYPKPSTKKIGVSENLKKCENVNSDEKLVCKKCTNFSSYRYHFQLYYEWQFTRNLAHHYVFKHFKRKCTKRSNYRRKLIVADFRRKCRTVYLDNEISVIKRRKPGDNSKASCNLIQWRSQPINPPQPRPSTSSTSSTAPNVSPFSLNLDGFNKDTLYAFATNGISHHFYELPKCKLPANIKFYPLPNAKIDSSGSHGFHISENIMGMGEVYNWVRSKVIEQNTSIFGIQNTQGQICDGKNDTSEHRTISQESMGALLNRYIQEELFEGNSEFANVAHPQSTPKGNNILELFKVPLHNPDLAKQADEDNFKVHAVLQNKPGLGSVSMSNSVRDIVPLNYPGFSDVSKSTLQQQTYNPVLPEAKKRNKEENVMSAGRCFEGRGVQKFNSVIIRNTPSSSNPKRKSDETNEQICSKKPTTDERKSQKGTSSVSVAFRDRGCGGKCIIPGENDKKSESVASETVKPSTSKSKQVVEVKEEKPVIKVEPIEVEQKVKIEDIKIKIEKPDVKYESIKVDTKVKIENLKVEQEASEPSVTLHIPENQETSQFNLLDAFENATNVNSGIEVKQEQTLFTEVKQEKVKPELLESHPASQECDESESQADSGIPGSMQHSVEQGESLSSSAEPDTRQLPLPGSHNQDTKQEPEPCSSNSSTNIKSPNMEIPKRIKHTKYRPGPLCSKRPKSKRPKAEDKTVCIPGNQTVGSFMNTMRHKLLDQPIKQVLDEVKDKTKNAVEVVDLE